MRALIERGKASLFPLRGGWLTLAIALPLTLTAGLWLISPPPAQESVRSDRLRQQWLKLLPLRVATRQNREVTLALLQQLQQPVLRQNFGMRSREAQGGSPFHRTGAVGVETSQEDCRIFHVLELAVWGPSGTLPPIAFPCRKEPKAHQVRFFVYGMFYSVPAGQILRKTADRLPHPHRAYAVARSFQESE